MISIPVSMILVAVGKTVGCSEGICDTNLEYKHLNQHGFFEEKQAQEALEMRFDFERQTLFNP